MPEDFTQFAREIVSLELLTGNSPIRIFSRDKRIMTSPLIQDYFKSVIGVAVGDGRAGNSRVSSIADFIESGGYEELTRKRGLRGDEIIELSEGMHDYHLLQRKFLEPFLREEELGFFQYLAIKNPQLDLADWISRNKGFNGNKLRGIIEGRESSNLREGFNGKHYKNCAIIIDLPYHLSKNFGIKEEDVRTAKKSLTNLYALCPLQKFAPQYIQI